MNKKYIKGYVNKITKNFVEVQTEDNKVGIIYINDVSDYYVRSLPEIFHLGEKLELLVKSFKDNVYFCDFKSGRADYLNFPFKYEIKETASAFQNLLNFNNKEVDK
jgi:ribosomal protein S1